jgi:hypothetical protein
VLDGGGNWLRTNLYATGKLLATYDSLGVHYALTDWLGANLVHRNRGGGLHSFIFAGLMLAQRFQLLNPSSYQALESDYGCRSTPRLRLEATNPFAQIGRADMYRGRAERDTGFLLRWRPVFCP